MTSLREDAFKIIQESINAVMPDTAVEKALAEHKNWLHSIKGRIVLVAIGKAAYTMARKASEVLGAQIDKGIVITKYDHLKDGLEHFECIEAGHPILDDNSVYAATRAIEIVSDLNQDDLVLFLVSGGGSAVFEKPYKGVTLQDITIVSDQLLASGANIHEMNTVRKHMSDVKGGRFAQHCGHAKIFEITLSDVIGNSLDTIASGPVHADSTTSEMALQVIDKYQIFIGEPVREALKVETPKKVENVKTFLAGSVRDLCESAAVTAKNLGYRPIIMSTSVDCEAKEAGRMLASIAKELKVSSSSSFSPDLPCAVIFGGEPVVTISGHGIGGRSQEVALSAAIEIEGLEGVTIFSVGSDGTDGPTDAAGGIVDGESAQIMQEENVDPIVHLNNNDSYRALNASGDLIMTGPTGTNVNDLMVILAK